MSEGAGLSMFEEESGRAFYARKIGDKYELYMAETKLEKFPDVSTAEDLARFEQNVGGRLQFTGSKHVARIFTAAINTLDSQPDTAEGQAYWRSVGERVAQAAKTPKPKMTEQEKKEKRKERRKQRDVERSGLPKGTKLPPKASAKDSDEKAKLKEIISIYESNFDELEYTINNIEPGDPSADALAADAVMQTMERIREERQELEEGKKEEMEDDLSLETPSDLELGTQIRTSEKVVVAMTDL
jgi:hypothetical protein